MGELSEPKPVKLVMGFIFANDSVFAKALAKLRRLYGEIDLSSQEYGFNYTDYYKEEMGASLKRRFISFKKLITPGKLAQIKLQTNRIEDGFAVKGKRRINIDPGWLDMARLVLATTKDFAHRIYIGKKIYAETTLLYRKNTFSPLEWTYPDYRSSTYWPFLYKIRSLYANQINTK